MVRYGLHPAELELSDGERYYERMAAKGWMLEHRGSTLSRFYRDEPNIISCHIALVGGAPLEGHDITDEQLELLKEAGWSLSGQSGLAYVFTGPKGASFPDSIFTEEQRRKTVRALRRSFLFGIAVLIFYLAVLAASFTCGGPNGIRESFSQLVCMLLEKPILTAAMCTAAIALPVSAAIEVWDGIKLYRTVESGGPIRCKNRIWWKVPLAFSTWSVILSIFLIVLGIIPSQKHVLPETHQEAYLLLSELGVSGERVISSIGGESAVYYHKSLLTEHWDCREFVNSGQGEEYLYQESYQLKIPEMADSLVRSMMNHSVFGRSEDNFIEVEAEGLDHAYYAGNFECIAVKGDRVLMMTRNFKDNEQIMMALNAAAEKWNR